MHIVNYELNNLKKNLPFRMDLVNIDKFRVFFNKKSSTKSPWWQKALNLRPSDLDLH